MCCGSCAPEPEKTPVCARCLHRHRYHPHVCYATLPGRQCLCEYYRAESNETAEGECRRLRNALTIIRENSHKPETIEAICSVALDKEA